MMSIYSSYKCRRCRKETILLTSEVQATIKAGRYITCSHCGSKAIFIDSVGDTLKDLMSHDKYRRVNGAIKQY